MANSTLTINNIKTEYIDPNQHYHQINNEFNDFFKEIPTQLNIYKSEFEKLFNALNKSHESETRLIRRSKEIITEITSSQEKLQKDIEEETDAKTYKKRLQLDIEVSWAQVNDANKIETAKQLKLNDLRTNIAILKEQLANGSGWSEHQDQLISKLKKQKTDIIKELDEKTNILNQLRLDVGTLHETLYKKEMETNEIEKEVMLLANESAEKKLIAENETRRKNILDTDLKNLKKKVEELQETIHEKEKSLEIGESTLKSKENHVREAKALMEKYLKEYDLIFRKTHRLTEDQQTQIQLNMVLQKENFQREEEIKKKIETVNKVSKECSKIEQLILLSQEKINTVETERVRYEAEKEQYRNNINDLISTTMKTEQKNGENLKKRIDDQHREREILNKMLIKAGDRTQEMYDLTKVNENTNKNLQNEINGYKNQVKKSREKVQQLINERERYEKEAEIATNKYLQSLEEVKLQQTQIVKIQSTINESETKLKQQQNLYEAVRSDRNLYSKNLIESQEEIAEMKRKFKIMNHQIEQLKEEITGKDHALVKEHFDHHKVDKEKELLKSELSRIKKQIQSSEQIISNQEQEISKLSQIIREADNEKQRQQKESNAVIGDRDNLRSQLILRNEELKKLYEKIKIEKSTLEKGEYQYNEKIKEIEHLNERIELLNCEKNNTTNEITSNSHLKNDIIKLEKELLNEQIKIKALSEELEHPLNIHRWRKLEGSDPKRFEMINKIHLLQKKLIKKTEEATIKNLAIVEKEKLYIELKNILARQPGPEVAEQLQVYQQNLKTKLNQHKALENELEMYKLQVEEYKRDINYINKNMKEVKDKWFQKMKIMDKNQNNPFNDNDPIIQDNNIPY